MNKQSKTWMVTVWFLMWMVVSVSEIRGIKAVVSCLEERGIEMSKREKKDFRSDQGDPIVPPNFS